MVMVTSYVYEIKRPDGTWDKKNIIVDEGVTIIEAAAIIKRHCPNEHIELKFKNGTLIWT